MYVLIGLVVSEAFEKKQLNSHLPNGQVDRSLVIIDLTVL